MVDLNGKPKCEILCPYENCSNVSKLSTIGQKDLTAAPKFNTFNFERHFQTQHVNKKRKPLDDITNRTDETPSKCTKDTFERNAPPQGPPMTSTSTHASVAVTADLIKVERLENEMIKQQTTIRHLQSENILLRHKMMDFRGTIRTFCRIKPDMGLDCFQWERSIDGNILKMDTTDRFKLDYIFTPNENNTDVFENIKPMIYSAAEGFNVSIIAYGASGTEF